MSDTMEDQPMYDADHPCPFCAIATGDTERHQIHMSDNTMSFLDAYPLTPGHLLVIPLAHYASIADVPAPVAAEIGAWIPPICRAMGKAYNVTNWNVITNNGRQAAQTVFHVHYHIVPRAGSEELDHKGKMISMFNLGKRKKLDDEQAGKDVERLKDALREEMNKVYREEGKAGLLPLGLPGLSDKYKTNL